MPTMKSTDQRKRIVFTLTVLSVFTTMTAVMWMFMPRERLLTDLTRPVLAIDTTLVMIYRRHLFRTQGAYRARCAPVRRRTDEKYQAGVTSSSSATYDLSRNEIISHGAYTAGTPLAMGETRLRQSSVLFVLDVRTSAQVVGNNDSRATATPCRGT